MARVLAALLALAAVAGCTTPKTCLAGVAACEEASVCDDLDGAFACDGAPELRVGRAADLGVDLRGAAGVGDDLVLQNDRITAVIDAIDAPRGLAPTGGTLIDLGPRGGRDDINNVYQLAGVLPDDAFAFDSVRVVDRSPDYVAAVFRGHLDGRPEVAVVTRYELRPCEPGIRVRSELENGGAEVQTFILSDLAHWGKRDALPFASLPGQGFEAPELDLLELQDVFFDHDYVLARAPQADAPTYGFLACDRDALAGVNDPEVSALGTPVTLLRPGESLTLERLVTATPGPDLDSGVRAMAAARAALLSRAPPIEVRARITAAGLPVEGTPTRAALLLAAADDGALRPLSVVVPGADGRLAAAVPAAAALRWELWSFGRPVAAGTTTARRDIDLGDIDIDPPARVNVHVAAGGAPIEAEVVLVPDDDATREATRGTWFGRLGECAPWLGPPTGGSPACNRALVPPEGADVEVPAGRYRLLATAGPGFTLAEARLDLAAGEVASADLALTELPLLPAGWLTADLHVHGRASFDSSLPDLDRVLSFVAHGVEVIAATDHDAVTDYAAAVEAAGIGDRVAVMGGVETTGLIPFLDVPGEDIPRVIGHFNHWPMQPQPDRPFGGLPGDERIEPGELFDRLEPRIGPDGVHMLNHPWDDPEFGRDLGYLRAIGFDPRVPIPASDDGTNNGMLMRAPAGGKRNIDFDLIELENGAGLAKVLATRPLWFSLLSQGFVKVAAANSDSHTLAINQLGYGRTWVDYGRPLSEFDPIRFDRVLKSGAAAGGNGVFILVTAGTGGGDRRGPGLDPYVPAGGDTLEIEVRAPPWIPVDEVRLVSSRGTRILASGDELAHPASPLDDHPVVRWRGTLALDDLVPGPGDDWLIIEAGLPLWDAADLDGDGVPDTGDNNGDGVVDERDIEDPDDDSGPLEDPADPTDPADPRYAMTRVVPGAWPYGFTNPLLVDRDGDGWDAPGLSR